VASYLRPKWSQISARQDFVYLKLGIVYCLRRKWYALCFESCLYSPLKVTCYFAHRFAIYNGIYTITYIYCHVYEGTRDVMTGSSSDDWILLALRLQSLLITLNLNTIAIRQTLQSLHSKPLSLFPLVFTIRFLARTPHGPNRKHSLYCWRSLFTEPFPSNRSLLLRCGPSRKHFYCIVYRQCMLDNLQSCCLAMLWWNPYFCSLYKLPLGCWVCV
jgi:hypothetical protein